MRLPVLGLVLALGLGAGCAEKPLKKPGAASAALASKSSKGKVPEAPIPASGDPESLAPLAVRRADYAITKIELLRAADLLKGEVGPDAARARARLSIYQADCEGALAHLASAAAQKAKGADQLLDLATRCKGATAGGIIFDDPDAGVWLRIQDEADRFLVPLLMEVAARARTGLEKDLGVDLPRPLRIDLVRDLFSLSAVSGLPLEAAETTGTVAVARWGRVTMVSPRAMQRGFPWADTLAHEITHLLLSRASADRAPLWLQEGIAKREEHRWRGSYPFDDEPDFSKRAFDAEESGKSVGVDAIGPSIAMLPSAEAASIAFAEVTSYMDFWIQKNGPRALSLLLRELEVAEDPEAAMRGVSGFDVAEWQLIWREDLKKRYASAPESPQDGIESDTLGPSALGRSLRLTELLTVGGFPGEAAELSSPDLDRSPHVAALRFMVGRAALLSGREDASDLLGTLDDVRGPDAGWLALRSRQMQTTQTDPLATKILAQAREQDPLLPEVACEGVPWVGKPTTNGDLPLATPEDQSWADLCAHTRELPVRGSR